MNFDLSQLDKIAKGAGPTKVPSLLTKFSAKPVRSGPFCRGSAAGRNANNHPN
jgi:hypothetical protein